MKLLAIDPGENIGHAEFQSTEQPRMRLVYFGTVKCKKPKFTECYKWLASLDTDYNVIVMERYMIRPKSAGGFDHSFNSGATLQIIGAIKGWAAQHDIEVFEQNSDIKTPAHAWAYGRSYKKKKDQHHLDAMLHGIYYQVKQLGVSPAEFKPT